MSEGAFAPVGSEAWFNQQKESLVSPFSMASSMAQSQEVNTAKSQVNRISEDTEGVVDVVNHGASGDASSGGTAQLAETPLAEQIFDVPPTSSKSKEDTASELMKLQLQANSDAFLANSDASDQNKDSPKEYHDGTSSSANGQQINSGFGDGPAPASFLQRDRTHSFVTQHFPNGFSS